MRFTRGDLARAATLILLIAVPAFAQIVPQRQAAAAVLTAGLTNEQFWKIISEFSEPGGTFPSDNYTSNELQIGQVAAELIAKGRTGGAYLGVGPEQNFTYIAATKPDIVFIVDIRRQAIMQHLMYKALFEMSNNRSEFISRVFSKPLQTVAERDTAIRAIWEKYITVPADSALYSANLAAIHNHLTKVRGLALSSEDSSSIALVFRVFYENGPFVNYSSRAGVNTPVTYSLTVGTFLSLTLVTDLDRVPRSFLASDANFRFVKALHAKNLIVPVVGNVGGPQTLRKVGEFLRQNNVVVASYYTSNVEGYLFNPPSRGPAPLFREFYANVETLPLDTASVFIRPYGTPVVVSSVVSLMATLPAAAPPPLGFRTPVPAGRPAEAPILTQLPTFGSFVGTVTDTITGAPVPGVRIRVEGSGLSGIADSAGRYRILNVPPGLHTLTTSSVGIYQMWVFDKRTVASAPTTVDFQTSAAPQLIPNRGGRAAASRVAGPPRPSVVFCPMIEFLAAYRAGRVLNGNDVTACARQ